MSDWSSYFAQSDGAPISIALDLEYSHHAPIDDKPVAYEVAIQLRYPNANGMTRADEYPTLVDIEDTLERHLRPEGLVQVGRVTGRKLRTLHYYGPEDARFAALVDAVMRQYPSYTYECMSADDPTWRVYVDYLYPDEHQLEFAKDMKILQALKQAGDNFQVQRDIEHVIEFRGAQLRDAFAKAVADRGFVVRIDSATSHVTAMKHLAIDPFAIAAMRTQLATLAQEFGGAYRGWSCSIQPD